MIPEFPNFKPLEITDREDVEKFTGDHPPYSDYNFVSLWCWNTADNIRLSQLHQNLVVEFSDYLTGEKFYSFFGENKVEKTIDMLFTEAQKKKFPLMMKLIPETNFRHGFPQKYTVTLDRNNFDYVYSVERIQTYPGSKLSAKRNYARRFYQKYAGDIQELDISADHARIAIEKVFYTWAEYKKLATTETEHEYKALSRFLALPESNKACCLGLYVQKKLVAFWLLEILTGKYAMSHFQKADLGQYVGVNPYLMQQSAHLLAERGVKFINNEQDLGIQGLREGKKDYHPIRYLKKFIITP